MFRLIRYAFYLYLGALAYNQFVSIMDDIGERGMRSVSISAAQGLVRLSRNTGDYLRLIRSDASSLPEYCRLNPKDQRLCYSAAYPTNRQRGYFSSGAKYHRTDQEQFTNDDNNSGHFGFNRLSAKLSAFLGPNNNSTLQNKASKLLHQAQTRKNQFLHSLNHNLTPAGPAA